MSKNLIEKKAPAFTLIDQNEEKITLKSFSGKWLVLYFYPKDNTPGCTTEACEFTEGIETFANLDAEVVGISPDSPATHRKFIDKHKLKINLLSDPEHKMMEKYQAWGVKKMYGKESMGVIRSTFIINPDGKILHHWPKVKAQGHAAQVAEKLNELQNK